MATYITLLRWTQKGIENVRESPNRLESAKNVSESWAERSKAFTW